MSQSRIINTHTTLNVIGSTITINTRYKNEFAGGVSLAFISDELNGEIVDSIAFKEGEGGIRMLDDYYPGSLDFSLDASSGDLIVIAKDASNYGIDEVSGELTYTY
jgi:hypothetical protein